MIGPFRRFFLTTVLLVLEVPRGALAIVLFFSVWHVHTTGAYESRWIDANRAEHAPAYYFFLGILVAGALGWSYVTFLAWSRLSSREGWWFAIDALHRKLR